MTNLLKRAADTLDDYEWPELARAVTKAADRIAALEAALREIDGLEVMEINPSNYDHDLVCELSRNAAYAAVVARDALNSEPEKGS